MRRTMRRDGEDMEEIKLEFSASPYRLEKKEKDRILTQQLTTLTQYHQEHCPEYGRMLQARKDLRQPQHYSDLPFLPVGLFKRLRLSSLSAETEDVKTVTSSGTSQQVSSQIILDAQTRSLQQKALAAIVGDFIGTKRMPMLIIDCPATVKKRDHYSARTAGILGFSIFGTHRTYALQDDLSLDEENIHTFLDLYGREPFLVFGFTFLVWEYFCQELKRKGKRLDLSQGILIHGGGWKKLAAQAVSEETFRSDLNEICGLTQIHDYYGMAEQTGSIFMECECGHLHASDYSGVLVRRAEDFSLCAYGERGILQVLSVLPRSYPGQSLLTEDEGVLLGEDDCPCGRKGAYFRVIGRIPHAELRGCSDTFERNSLARGAR